MKVKNNSRHTIPLYIDGDVSFAPGKVLDMPKALYNCLKGMYDLEVVVEKEVKVVSEPAPIEKGQTNDKSKKSRK